MGLFRFLRLLGIYFGILEFLGFLFSDWLKAKSLFKMANGIRTFEIFEILWTFGIFLDLWDSVGFFGCLVFS